MKIYPAIDIKDGKCVRLKQGLANQKTVYYKNPIDAAKMFIDSGADRIHIVDLDGAFDGQLKNISIIENIAKLEIFTQLGGGLRDMQSVKTILNAGVSRAIIGTKACTHPEFIDELLSLFDKKIAVGIDAKNGKVAVKGWVEVIDKDALEFASEITEKGVSTIIYTDISTDGMLTGVNIIAQTKMMETISKNNAFLIASGGVSSNQDIINLQNLKNLDGVIVGKAIYEKKVNLKEIISLTK